MIIMGNSYFPIRQIFITGNSDVEINQGKNRKFLISLKVVFSRKDMVEAKENISSCKREGELNIFYQVY